MKPTEHVQIFRRKPREVQAIQWDGTFDGYLRLNWWAEGVFEWRRTQSTVSATDLATGEVKVVSLDQPLPNRVKMFVEGDGVWLTLGVGDWAVKDGSRFRSYTPDAFAAEYEAVPS